MKNDTNKINNNLQSIKIYFNDLFNSIDATIKEIIHFKKWYIWNKAKYYNKLLQEFKQRFKFIEYFIYDTSFLILKDNIKAKLDLLITVMFEHGYIEMV